MPAIEAEKTPKSAASGEGDAGDEEEWILAWA